MDISLKGISKMVIGGDIGAAASNEWFFESLKDFDISVVSGNHDLFTEVRKYFGLGMFEYKSALYYTEVFQNYKLIFLDSSIGSI